MAPNVINEGTDPFSLLGLPRRPVIDLDLLEKNFRALAAQHHPDQATGTTTSFEQLQTAANLLRHPSTRLRVLAGEVALDKKPAIPSIAEDLFLMIASALHDAQEAINAYHAASHALAKALLMDKLVASNAALTTAQQALLAWQSSLDQELASLDLRWPNTTPTELLTLATHFTFFTRWEEQLRERIVELKIILG